MHMFSVKWLLFRIRSLGFISTLKMCSGELLCSPGRQSQLPSCFDTVCGQFLLNAFVRNSRFAFKPKTEWIICVEDGESWWFLSVYDKTFEISFRYLWFECPTPANSSSKNWCLWVLHLVWWVFSLKGAFFFFLIMRLKCSGFVSFCIRCIQNYSFTHLVCAVQNVCLFPVNRIKICNQTCESICVSVK